MCNLVVLSCRVWYCVEKEKMWEMGEEKFVIRGRVKICNKIEKKKKKEKMLYRLE